jgi:hypothetical protein
VKPYNPSLKNFWYPVAFSIDLKDDTMVMHWMFQAITNSKLGVTEARAYLMGSCVAFLGTNRLFRGTVGDIPWKRWKTWLCAEHLCSQSLPPSSWFSKRGQNPVPLPG